MIRKFLDVLASETTGGNESPEQQNDKVEKAYQSTVQKLSAILDMPLKDAVKKGKKVQRDAVANLVAGMFKEQQEATVKEVVEGLKTNLENFVKMNQEIGKKEKELEKLKVDQKKAFNESCKKLFDKIEGLPELEKTYVDALKGATT